MTLTAGESLVFVIDLNEVGRLGEGEYCLTVYERWVAGWPTGTWCSWWPRYAIGDVVTMRGEEGETWQGTVLDVLDNKLGHGYRVEIDLDSCSRVSLTS